MAALKQQFLSRTNGDLALFIAAMKRRDMEEIRSISHRLAGVAGVFGFPELGASASEVEDALDRGAPPLEINRSCARLVDQLRRLPPGTAAQ